MQLINNSNTALQVSTFNAESSTTTTLVLQQGDAATVTPFPGAVTVSTSATSITASPALLVDAKFAAGLGDVTYAMRFDTSAILFSPKLGSVIGAYTWWYRVKLNATGETAVLFGGVWDPVAGAPNPPGAAVGVYTNKALNATWVNPNSGAVATPPNLPVPEGFELVGGSATPAQLVVPTWFKEPCPIWTPFSITFFTLFLAAVVVIIVASAVMSANRGAYQ